MIPRSPIPSPPEGPLRWSIDEPPPSRIAVGGGSAVPVTGWCFHRERPIKDLQFVVGGHRVAMLAQSLPRPDVHRVLHPESDPLGHSYASGFYGVIPFHGVEHAQPLEIALRASFGGLRRQQTVVDRIELTRRLDTSPHPALAGASVAICMATYDPDYELFARQIESIADQTLGGWRCLISDDLSAPHTFDRISALVAGDDRFVVDRGSHRLGAYHNFERSLASVGPETELVALADQDDRWRPDKLERLADALSGGALLAYSDCRIVRPDGAPLSDTFFPRRRNNWRDLRSLVIANTVTGAATMLRRELLDDALPFPPYTPGAFHDHWLACVALSLGELAYVDRPLWDYVQHGENLLGYAIGQRLLIAEARGEWMLHHRVVYRYLLMRIVALARALELRVGERMPRSKRNDLRRIASLERSPVAFAQLALRAAGEGPETSPTLGLERELFGAMLWRRRMARAGRRGDKQGDMRFSSTMEPRPEAAVHAAALDAVAAISSRTAPLRLAVSRREPVRMNFLLGAPVEDGLHPEHAAPVHLAAAVKRAGTHTRLLSTDGTWTSEHELTEAASGLELVDVADRSRALSVNPDDLFVATSWWTARIAHAAMAELSGRRFVFLIRDYEPPAVASPGGAAEAKATYELPHLALFCSEVVREYFEGRRLGVYATEMSDHIVTLDEPMRPPATPRLEALHRPGPRRLLLHAPPERAARSLPELAIMALTALAEEGLLNGWELSAIGLPGGLGTIELASGVELSVLGDLGRESWSQLLRANDVGIALAGGARPSLAAFEMAAAGLVAVTNTYFAKAEPWLAERSGNLVAVEPSAEGIAQGLRAALGRAGDLEARIAGSAVDWPTSWAETLNRGVVDKLTEALRARLF